MGEINYKADAQRVVDKAAEVLLKEGDNGEEAAETYLKMADAYVWIYSIADAEDTQAVLEAKRLLPLAEADLDAGRIRAAAKTLRVIEYWDHIDMWNRRLNQ
jgi:hypothetical protein